MRKYLKQIGLGIALVSISSHATAQSCSVDFTKSTSKMVFGAFFDNTGGMDSPAYLRQEGSTVYIDVLNHTTGAIHEGVGVIPNYYLSNVEDRIVSGDFDGDGVHDDIAVIYQTGTSSCRIDVFARNGGVYGGYGFTNHLNEWSTTGYQADLIKGRIVSGLFDNDIYYDIAAFYDYGGGQTRIHVWKFQYNINPVYQGASGWWSTYGYTAGQITDRVVSGDFDRDGKWNDIAAFYDYGGGQTRIHVWESTGSSFDYQGGSGWYTFPYGYQANNISERVVAGDFDRDGKDDDICAFYDYGSGATRAHVWESNGSSFDYPNGNNGYWMVTSGYSASAINGKIALVPQGNKLSDLAVLYNYGSNTTKYHHFEAKNPVFGNEYFDYSWVNFCPSKSASTEEEQLSAEAFSIEQSKIYPNPSSDFINVQLAKKFTEQPSTLYIRDMAGNLIKEISSERLSSTIYQIDLTALPSGMYIIQLINEDGEQELMKLTKQ